MKVFTDRNFRAIFLFGMGIYFIINQATRENPESISELISLKGKIVNYSFNKNTGWRGQGYHYFVSLNEYPNKFQVSASFLKFFNEVQFEQNFREGTPIELSFSQYQEPLLGTEEAIILFSLSMNGVEYLTSEQTINFENKSNTKNSGYLLGIIFIILGILVLLFFDKMKSVSRISKKNF